MSEKSRSLGVLVWNEPHWSRVPEDLLSGLAASATLNGQAIPILSTNAAQSDDGSGEGRLEPAEIVFDASSTISTGWNVLRLPFSSPVVWNSFDNQKNGASVFRLDSAPSIMRLVFSPADRRIDVEFSELIASNLTAKPLHVSSAAAFRHDHRERLRFGGGLELQARRHTVGVAASARWFAPAPPQ